MLLCAWVAVLSVHARAICKRAYHATQAGDENYDLALDYCLQRAYYHSHGDVNPTEVESVYAGCVCSSSSSVSSTARTPLCTLPSCQHTAAPTPFHPPPP